jgi:tRNA(Arg) A34 adenosine deaminase TadA
VLTSACVACQSWTHGGSLMSELAALRQQEADAYFLRRSFEVARRSLTHGNHPFGAVLVDRDRNMLIEAENGYMPSRDGTAHAERLLATRACTTLSPEILIGATLYSSAEPCAMCAGAIYWAGIGRLVYGLSEHGLREFTGNHPENPTLDLPCREVLRRGQRPTEIVGPMLEDEAAQFTKASGANSQSRREVHAPRAQFSGKARRTVCDRPADQTLGTILTRASCTALSRSASCWGSWYGMARIV